jgi:glycosyltransferase involved in cell wall biosynthesis
MTMTTPGELLEHPGAAAGGVTTPATTTDVEIVVPVRDEEHDLGPSVRRLHAYLTAGFPFTARVTIADNGSRDGTWAQAQELAAELSGVRAVRLEQPDRGRALRSAWLASRATAAAYMDVDLSTDLNALLPLVAPLLSGHSDVAIGTRLARGARVSRGPRRAILSRGYNLLLRACLGTRFSDAQCGFKAIRRDQADLLLAQTQDASWFFDTELLVLAERAGLRIHEVPVDWVDDADSRVRLLATAAADLRGIVRLGGGRRLARFAAVGAASTLAYVLLYFVTSAGHHLTRRRRAWPCAASWALRPRTRPACSAPPSPIPRSTGGSPSASADAGTRCGISGGGCWRSAPACCSPPGRWPDCTRSPPGRGARPRSPCCWRPPRWPPESGSCSTRAGCSVEPPDDRPHGRPPGWTGRWPGGRGGSGPRWPPC